MLNKLALLPYGLWLVSHAQEKEVDTARGKIMRTMPTLPDKARKVVMGMVDMILYCDIETAPAGEGGQPVHRRVIRTKPTLVYEAGDRTGRLPEMIDRSISRRSSRPSWPAAHPPRSGLPPRRPPNHKSEEIESWITT